MFLFGQQWRGSCITSDLRMFRFERLGLVFYRFKRANPSPTDRADCPANGAYNALDSLRDELDRLMRLK